MIVICILLVTSVFAAVPENMTWETKEKFAHSLVNENCDNAKLEYFENYNGWGLIATNNLDVGEFYCTIPTAMVYSTFEDWEWSKAFQKEHPRIRLMAQLIYHKFVNPDLDSFKWKWINHLDENVHSPCVWEDDELQNLMRWSGNPALLKEKFEDFEELYENFEVLMRKVAPNCEACRSHETYTWTQMLISSRAFGAKEKDWRWVLGKEPKPTENLGYNLYPIFDYVNHSNYFVEKGQKRPTATTYFQEPYPQVRIFTQVPVPVGQEIFHQYNSMSNIELLWNFGFVMLKNVYQSFDLLVDKNTDECPREALDEKLNEGCRFEIFPNVFNYAMLRYINKNNTSESYKEKFIQGLLAYRRVIIAETGRMTSLLLREARHLKSEEVNPRNLLSLDYVASLRIAIYDHRELLDLMIMEEHLKTLGIF